MKYPIVGLAGKNVLVVVDLWPTHTVSGREFTTPIGVRAVR